MSVDWRRWARRHYRLDGERVLVKLTGQRKQLVWCEERGSGSLRLWSIVLRRAEVEELGIGHLHAWLRNRLSELVAFRLDEKGRMIGEVVLPPVGITEDEWVLCTQVLAKACDRAEHVLSGVDVS